MLVFLFTLFALGGQEEMSISSDQEGAACLPPHICIWGFVKNAVSFSKLIMGKLKLFNMLVRVFAEIIITGGADLPPLEETELISYI